MRNFHFFGPVLTWLYLAVNFYVAGWLLRFFKPGRRAAAALYAVFAALALSYPAAHALEAAAGGAPGLGGRRCACSPILSCR